jgi:hypothetical protein
VDAALDRIILAFSISYFDRFPIFLFFLLALFCSLRFFSDMAYFLMDSIRLLGFIYCIGASFFSAIGIISSV